MIVADASVVVAALVDTTIAGGWAADVLSSGDLAAPPLLHVEVASALRKQAARGDLSDVAAGIAFGDLQALSVSLYDFEVVAERVWELRGAVTPYDAWYVALAELLGVPLATLDRKLANAAGTRCEFLVPPTPTTRDEASGLEGNGWDGDLDAMRDDPDPSGGR